MKLLRHAQSSGSTRAYRNSSLWKIRIRKDFPWIHLITFQCFQRRQKKKRSLRTMKPQTKEHYKSEIWMKVDMAQFEKRRESKLVRLSSACEARISNFTYSGFLKKIKNSSHLSETNMCLLLSSHFNEQKLFFALNWDSQLIRKGKEKTISIAIHVETEYRNTIGHMKVVMYR